MTRLISLVQETILFWLFPKYYCSNYAFELPTHQITRLGQHAMPCASNFDAPDAPLAAGGHWRVPESDSIRRVKK